MMVTKFSNYERHLLEDNDNLYVVSGILPESISRGTIVGRVLMSCDSLGNLLMKAQVKK